MAGNVSIRFSVENEETVRKALEGLGPAGEKAMRQLDAASRSPNAGLNAISKVIEELRGRATGFAFSLGPVGTGLVALGPVGLTAAAVLGGVITVFKALSEQANEFAEKAKQIKESAETAGLSIAAFKGLRDAGAQFGVDAQQVSAFVERLTVGIEELRRGGGPLYEQLIRIDAGLAREAATAATTADAIDVLARARARLSQAQKNELDRAIGGRGGIGSGQIFDAVSEKGGMAALEQGAAGANRETEKLTKTAAELKTQIEAIKRETSEMWGANNVRVLQQNKEVAEDWRAITKAILGAQEALTKWWNSAPQPRGPGRTPSLWEARERSAFLARLEEEARGTGATMEPPRVTAPWDVRTTVPEKAEKLLSDMRRWTTLLGDALTPTEQMTQKLLELAAAQEKGGVSDEVRTRSLVAFIQAQERVLVSTRTTLSIVTEEELLRVRMIELDKAAADGAFKSAEERAAAERLARREIKETTDALRVRNSETPQLTRLSIDAAKLTNNLDEGLAGALRGTNTTMLEMARGTKTLSQGLSDLSVKLLEAVFNALWMRSVVGPIANSLSGGLSSFFGGGGGSGIDVSENAFGNAFFGGHVSAFAQGGIFDRPTIFPMARGMGLMGEAGPEAVMPLQRLGNGRLGVSAAGMQTNVTVQIVNNHPNAQISTREESDGPGGRKTIAVIEEMVASALTRPKSPALKALGASRSMVKR